MTPQLGEVRALLALFGRSQLRDLWVSAGDWSVFLARADGAANPAAGATVAQPVAAPAAEHVVTAPHLGIVCELTPTASVVAQGQRIAELRVLDERRPVLADRAGTVTALLAGEDALVEFGQPLLTIA